MLTDSSHLDQAERRERILDAAERRFIQAGFHRATMQDVAREAGMSPGNLYRYFPSKDAIVEGLVERDRAALIEDFESFPSSCRIGTVLGALARKHFEEEPREKAVLALQIWAEATVNEAVAAANESIDREIVVRLVELIAAAKSRGEVAAGVDEHATAELVMAMSYGLFVRRALAPDFDPRRETQALLATIEGILRGDIALSPAPVETSI
ncbi:TetR/AcrR family transcriptional regulator [Chelatococcus sp. GCM10030263]|uniref:TetR/AcrR family transcriptional regulator n=1 Tax=Chelatococcus sp. GCM10030263 TaxID=3273387 RepID=UPI003614D37B